MDIVALRGKGSASHTIWRRHSLRSYLHVSSLRRKLMRAESVRSAGMAICSSSTPTLYMSKRSGLFSCHRMGDSIAATGGGGARGVCMPHQRRSSKGKKGIQDLVHSPAHWTIACL